MSSSLLTRGVRGVLGFVGALPLGDDVGVGFVAFKVDLLRINTTDERVRDSGSIDLVALT